MLALGFLAREDERYRNQPVAQVYLSGQEPTDLRPALRFFDRISYPTWIHLDEALRERRGVRGDLSTGQNTIRSRGIEALTAPAAQALAQSDAVAGCRRLLDLRGGLGSFLRILAQRHPQLEVTLFEMPAVAALARQALRATPEGARIAVVEGDFFRDPLPPGHDAVLLANVLHLFSPMHNRELLARIRAAVQPGTSLLLVDFWTDASHTQPLFAVLLAGEWLTATGKADCYSVEEVHGWLDVTGWTLEGHHPLAGPASLIVAQATKE